MDGLLTNANTIRQSSNASFPMRALAAIRSNTITVEIPANIQISRSRSVRILTLTLVIFVYNSCVLGSCQERSMDQLGMSREWAWITWYDMPWLLQESQQHGLFRKNSILLTLIKEICLVFKTEAIVRYTGGRRWQVKGRDIDDAVRVAINGVCTISMPRIVKKKRKEFRLGYSTWKSPDNE